ncbi:MAG: GxxExxY protein [Deltaproteobacteria bacterium]|nr:GxxExxY protein [Deltaproteobacteria bacterium]
MRAETNHRDTETQRDPLSDKIIGAAIEVHRNLGPGLLESIYEQCLAHELEASGLTFQRQVEILVIYKGRRLDAVYRVDLVVDQEIIVELKCVERLLPIHEAQLLTYLRMTNLRKGLLLNFNIPTMRAGIKRMVL